MLLDKQTRDWSAVNIIPWVLERGRWRLRWEQTPICPSFFVLCIGNIDYKTKVNFTRLLSLFHPQRTEWGWMILPVAAGRLNIKLQLSEFLFHCGPTWPRGTEAALREHSTRSPSSASRCGRWRWRWRRRTREGPWTSRRPSGRPPRTDPDGSHILSARGGNHTRIICYQHNQTSWSCDGWDDVTLTPTLSLFSLRFTMTALICWSMKMRIVTRRAGTKLAT